MEKLGISGLLVGLIGIIYKFQTERINNCQTKEVCKLKEENIDQKLNNIHEKLNRMHEDMEKIKNSLNII